MGAQADARRFVRHHLEPRSARFRGNDRQIPRFRQREDIKENIMNNLIWLVGAIVIVLAILSFFGLR